MPNGDEWFDGLADERFAGISEQLFRLSIQEDDQPGFVHDEHGYRSRIKQTSKRAVGELDRAHLLRSCTFLKEPRYLGAHTVARDRKLRTQVSQVNAPLC